MKGIRPFVMQKGIITDRTNVADIYNNDKIRLSKPRGAGFIFFICNEEKRYQRVQ